MTHTLSAILHPAAVRSKSTYRVDDPLDAMRGIIFATLASVLGFWLPLALVVRWPN